MPRSAPWSAANLAAHNIASVAGVLDRLVTHSKRCPACRQTLDLCEFSPSPSRPDGRNPVCRSCDAARHRLARLRRQARDKIVAEWSERSAEIDSDWLALASAWAARDQQREGGAVRGGWKRTPESMAPAQQAAADLKHEQLAERIASGVKWCARCQRTVPREQFGRGAGPDGLAGWCLPCYATDSRARAARKRDALQHAAEVAVVVARLNERECPGCRTMRQVGEFAGRRYCQQCVAQAAAHEREMTKRRQSFGGKRPSGPVGPFVATRDVVCRACNGPLVWDAGADWWHLQHVAGCRARWQPSDPARKSELLVA
jgi:hypothetical protein